ncbi:hypothetical protein [Brevibacillus parabrevis]|uniref:hypothetical protein n=1 Tax=Brevibacillus parabrevis TaxID=54914 RepID=UPI0023801880|nr:hypothetical protein [Brevibacillus parabrevis]MED2256574.1 hypothetical protein [Brevibacillus parabrevis]WDV96694.1 hypothetical protein PSE45_07025 [Brevibacillus parabrevis]
MDKENQGLQTKIFDLIEQEGLEEQLESLTRNVFEDCISRNTIELRRINPSFIRLIAMLLKKSSFHVIGRIEDSFIKDKKTATGSPPAAGYRFQEGFGKWYDLRVEDALLLVKYGNVTNLEINPNENYFIGKGIDLRKLPRVATAPGTIFTDEEMQNYLVWFKGIQVQMGIQPTII